jgi:hypothetical protein
MDRSFLGPDKGRGRRDTVKTKGTGIAAADGSRKGLDVAVVLSAPRATPAEAAILDLGGQPMVRQVHSTKQCFEHDESIWRAALRLKERTACLNITLVDAT